MPDVDNSDTTATVDANSTGSDPAQTAPLDQSAPQDSAPASGTDQTPAPEDTSPGTDTGSQALSDKATDEVPHNTPPQVQSPEDYARQVREITAKHREQGRILAENKRRLQEYERNFSGVDPEAVRRFRDQQQQAEKAKLPIWKKDHPENGKFLDTIRRFKDYQQALSRADTPEKKQVLKDTIGASFTEDDAKRIGDWRQHQEQFSERLAADPEGTFEEIADRRFEQRMQQWQQQQEAAQTVGKWFDDPANKPIVETMAPAMQEMLTELGGTDAAWKFTQAMAEKEFRLQQLEQQLRAVQNRVGAVNQKEAAVNEQQRLLKTKAAVHRDPTGTQPVDPMKVAHKRGIRPGSPEYFDLLTELSAAGQLS